MFSEKGKIWKLLDDQAKTLKVQYKLIQLVLQKKLVLAVKMNLLLLAGMGGRWYFK